MSFRLIIAVLVSSNLFLTDLRADDINIKGFYTLGVMWLESDNEHHQYLKEVDENANFRALTRLGLNLNSVLDDHWSVYGQLVAKQSKDDAVLRADWMFVSYDFNDSLQVRGGKIKSNIWAISDYVDVGKIYLWANPPDEVYEMFPVKSYNGASITFKKEMSGLSTTFEMGGGRNNLALGELSGESFNMITTDLRIFNFKLEYAPYTLRGSYFTGTNTSVLESETIVKIDNTIKTIALTADFEDIYFMAEYAVVGASMSRAFEGSALQAEANAAISDLTAMEKNLQRLRAAEATARSNVDITDEASLDTYNQAIAERAAAEISYNLALEKAGESFRNLGFHQSQVDGLNAYHLTAGYHLSEKSSIYTTLAQLNAPDNPAFFSDQRSVALGFVYEANYNIDLKFEVKEIEVLNDERGFFSPKDFSNPQPLSDNRARKYTFSVNSIF